MKFYALEDEGMEVMGIYSTPRKARKALEKDLGISTKGKWEKWSNINMRNFSYDGHIYWIIEFTLDEEI